MMAAPIASVELSRRLMRVNIAYTTMRMGVIAARSGDPSAIAIRHIDGVAALMSRAVPSPAFNQVIGLREGQEDLVGTLDDWYREHKIKGRFAMAPGDFTPALGRALAERGYVQSEFDTVLYALPPAPDLPIADAAISEVDSADAMEEFLDALLTGWAIPRQHHDGAKANMRGWLGQPDWRLYLARVDGKPAAAAKLFLHDRVGYFADAATRPDHRGRGLQTALLRHRAAVAAQMGVELIYSQAAFGSASHRNMERIGLRVLHTRAIWTKL
jgi:GNAT superfamily N-acetyltransferase